VRLLWRDVDRLHIDRVVLEVLERDETHAEEVAVLDCARFWDAVVAAVRRLG
jgi:hypothetical protein